MKHLYILDEQDVENASPEFRDELHSMKGNRGMHAIIDETEDSGHLVALGPIQAKRFMEVPRQVSDITRKMARVLAENNGRASPDEFLTVTGYSNPRQLTGALSGMTQRIRKMFGRNASFYDWEWDKNIEDGEHESFDGTYYISPISARSLRLYFGIEDDA